MDNNSSASLLREPLRDVDFLTLENNNPIERKSKKELKLVFSLKEWEEEMERRRAIEVEEEQHANNWQNQVCLIETKNL